MKGIGSSVLVTKRKKEPRIPVGRIQLSILNYLVENGGWHTIYNIASGTGIHGRRGINNLLMRYVGIGVVEIDKNDLTVPYGYRRFRFTGFNGTERSTMVRAYLLRAKLSDKIYKKKIEDALDF